MEVRALSDVAFFHFVVKKRLCPADMTGTPFRIIGLYIQKA